MTTTTAASLVRSLTSEEPLTLSVLVDYFGMAAVDEERLRVLLGVYEGMVRFKFVTAALLHNCFLTNRLDELIRVKHVHWRSGYYEELVARGIVVGRTCLARGRAQRVAPLPLLDDDHCASCGGAGYVTAGNRSFGAAPDCERCFAGVCRLCVVRDAGGACVCAACGAARLE